MTYMKSGQPFLYDDETGDIVGTRNAETGRETLIPSWGQDASGNLSLIGPDGNIYDPRIKTAKSRIIAGASNGINVAGGWSNATGAGGPTLTVETENVRVPGRPVLRLAAGPTGTAVYTTTRIKLPAMPIYGEFELWYYVPDYTGGNLNAVLIYSSDTPAADPPTASPSNRRTLSLPVGTQQKGRWNCVRINVAATAAQSPTGATWADTGTPDNNEIEYLELVTNCQAAVPDGVRYVLFDVVAIGGGSTPIIMLGNDGNQASILSTAVPYLKQYGMRGYNAFDADLLAANRSQKDQIYDAGWDLITQGLNHTDYGADPAQLVIDLPTALGYMAAAGYARGSDCFCYPLNSATFGTSETLLENGIVAARESNNTQLVVSNLGRQEIIGCGSYDCGQKTSANMQAVVETAKLHGTSMWMYWHDLVASAGTSTETTISEWQSFIQYLAVEQAAGRVIVATPTEFIGLTEKFTPA